jgi:hypothetical protein
MKKLSNLFMILAIVAIGFVSCEKEKVEQPGEIPGMGNAEGELEIAEKFVAPAGIEISGLEGVPTTGVSVTGTNVLKSSNTYSSYHCGSGGSFNGDVFRAWINIGLTIYNSSTEERCVTFPQGLVFKVSDPEYQNALLLSDVKICVKGGETIQITLHAYCINKGKDGSDADVNYTILGTTSSDVIKKLLDLVSERLINLQYYSGENTSTALKSVAAEDISVYYERAHHLQEAVWTLTNDGQDLSSDQINYIKSIPMVQ